MFQVQLGAYIDKGALASSFLFRHRCEKMQLLKLFSTCTCVALAVLRRKCILARSVVPLACARGQAKVQHDMQLDNSGMYMVAKVATS